jgi:hypothetical protein
VVVSKVGLGVVAGMANGSFDSWPQMNGEVPRRRGASSRTGSSRAGARSGGGGAQGLDIWGRSSATCIFPAALPASVAGFPGRNSRHF